MKKNITITLKLSDAKNVFYHLRDTPCYQDTRYPSVKKAKVKLGRQIEVAEHINSTLRPAAGAAATAN